jgi:hypothetical protein
LEGAVSDDGLPDGSTQAITWSKVSGPGAVTFSNPSQAVTVAAFSAAGAYVLRLSASDSQLTSSDDVTVIVNPPTPTNQAPSVSSGADQTITLPDTARLNGTASDDGLPTGSTLALSWSKVSGPGTVTFGNQGAAATTAAFSTAGTYILRLTATDSVLSSSAEVSIIVNPANQPPSVSAGPDQTITLPSTATLNGTATDDGLPKGSTLAISWSQVSGPGTVTFSNPNQLDIKATFSEAGTYVLRLTVNDSELTASDDATVAVNPANQPPSVNAGPDQTAILPNTANLSGTVSDDSLPAGGTLSYTWSVASGPRLDAVTFSNPNQLVTTASFSAAGTYVLRLTVNDSDLTSIDDVTITAIAPNQPPVVSAGSDQTITVTDTVTLNGTVTDDGSPAGGTLVVSWNQVSGPGTVTFSNVNTVTTTASFSLAGTYVLRLTAGDSELTSSDDITIKANADNQPP